MIFQAMIFDTSTGIGLDPGQLSSSATAIGISILLPFSIIMGTIAILFFLRIFLKHRFEHLASFDQVVLQILVPKERKDDKTGSASETQSIQKIREDIGVMETLFANIGGLHAQRGLKAWLFGRDDHFSFEMVNHGGLIYFYVAVPRVMQHFIEEQIHSQFPAAVIEESRDYNIFTPTGNILAGYLSFKRKNAFPIKTYKKSDSDPLNAIANSLAKVQAPDGAAIQIVVRSAKKHWRKEGIWLARDIQQGGKFEKLATKGALATFFHHYIATKHKPKDMSTQYHLSPMETEVVKGLEEKASRAGLDVNIRIIVCSTEKMRARQMFDQIAGAFAQFNSYHYGNSFSVLVPSGQNRIIRDFIYRVLHERRGMVMNTEELASLYHIPLPTNETPNIKWLTARKAPPPNNLPKEGIVLGFNDYRGIHTDIRIARDDRARHMYIIGKSGTGKSVFQENLAAQDILNGDGVCVIDPHGDLVDMVLSHVPASRADDVILFDPTDIARPQGLNLMEFDPNYPEQKTFVINETMKIFDKLYDLKATGGPMFEQYMRNAMLLLMEDTESGSTLMEVPKLLADEDYRRFKLSKCKNPTVYDFWTKEAQKAGGEASLQNMVPYITSKLNQFVSNDYMRPIIGQQSSAFNFRHVMDQKKILLVKLSKGKIGDMNAYLLGMIIVGKILMAALSRTDAPEDKRPDFYLYIDEFQNFITDSIATILSEARKYRLNLIIAHQYVGQLVQNNDTRIRDAIFGNVGTMVAFRIGAEDGEFLQKEFAPVFSSYDLINIENRTAYIKLLINGTNAKPFNMGINKYAERNTELAEAIRQLARLKQGRDRGLIEEEIRSRAFNVTY